MASEVVSELALVALGPMVLDLEVLVPIVLVLRALVPMLLVLALVASELAPGFEVEVVEMETPYSGDLLPTCKTLQLVFGIQTTFS